MVSKRKLRKMYWDGEMSQRDIADFLDCSRSKIRSLINEYNIDQRNNNCDIEKEYLRELYHEKEWSQKKIAEEVGCSRSTIGNYLERYGIDKREHSDSLKIAYKSCRKKTPINVGEKNPFFGREHDKSSIKKMKKAANGRCDDKKHPMKNRSFFDV